MRNIPPHRPLARAVAVTATRLHAPVSWYEVAAALTLLGAMLWSLAR